MTQMSADWETGANRMDRIGRMRRRRPGLEYGEARASARYLPMMDRLSRGEPAPDVMARSRAET